MKPIILLTIFLFVLQICLARKEIDVVRLVNCPEYKNCTCIYKNIVFTRNKKGRISTMRYDLIFKKELKRMMIVVTVRKCENSDNLDSCEYYMEDLKIENACDIIGQKNKLWSEAVANSNLPRSCPIAAGTYKVNDTKVLNMGPALMSIPVALWKIRYIIHDSGNDNIMVGCVDVDVKIYTSRRN